MGTIRRGVDSAAEPPDSGGAKRTLKSAVESAVESAAESAAEPPTSPPESASGVESASGLVRGGQSTDPPRSRSESAADFKVRLESAGVRLESAGVRQNSYESTRNIFWRSSSGVRSESARSPLGVRSESGGSATDSAHYYIGVE